MLDLPPSTYALGSAAAYTTNGLAYLANAAQLIISNSISGTNWGGYLTVTNSMAVYYQDLTYVSSPLNSNPRNMANSLIWVTNDFYIITNSKMASAPRIYFTNYVSPTLLGTNANGYTNILYAGYSFLTNVLFYDWREGWSISSSVKHGKPVQAVQFDVNKYNLWLSNSAVNGGAFYNNLSRNHWHHSIASVYIYTSVPATETKLPAVRVVNGSQLFDSYGLTVATPFPLYVKGDYNVSDGSGSNAGQNSTTHTRPAGLMGDSMTFLSGNWNDSKTNKLPSSSSIATLNAAILAGIVPSNPGLGTPSDDSDYSGGVENFFRLLEAWGTFYFNGSIVALFPSEYATNRWRQTGNFYGAPTRKWAFDTNFTMLSKLPPMTPLVINSNLAPSITIQPTNQFVLTGQSANFGVTAAGVPAVNYQWNFNGTNIPNATNVSLALTDLQLTNAGNYAVQITNVLGAIISSNAVLSVYSSAAATMNANSYSDENGFQFHVTGVPGFHYAVQSSTNLIDWTSLITNTSPFDFTDPDAAGFSQQFYRSVYLP